LDGAGSRIDLPDKPSEIFFQTGLDTDLPDRCKWRQRRSWRPPTGSSLTTLAAFGQMATPLLD
jgi:hypothetical protein